ncbi:MAG: EpsG family protein [Bacteroides fragilis]|nr:EpsG family protein [Bacteroides fragilis]
MSCNNASPDERNMYNNYYDESIGVRDSSLLFYVLVRVCREWGISFGWFNFITITFAFILIISCISRYVKAWGFVISLYFIAGAILDVSYYRQFLAAAIVIYGFCYILGSAKHPYKYIACVLLASTLHLAMISYMVFVLIVLEKKQRRKVIAVIGILSVVMIGGTLLNDRVMPGIRLVARYIKSDLKLQQYISVASGRFGWMYMAVLCMGCIFVTKVMQSMLNRRVMDGEREQRQCMRSLYDINVISVVFIPLCVMYFSVFSRLYRPLIWTNLLALAMVVEKIPARKLNLKWLCCAAGYVAYVFGVYHIIIADWVRFGKVIFKGTFFWI